MQINLKDGVLPISKAASSLARQIKRAQETAQPIVITQKGYPQAVLLSIDAYEALRGLSGQSEQTDGQIDQDQAE